jgi:hypothetical protein
MLYIQEADGRWWTLDARKHHGKRKMDRIELVEPKLAAERPGDNGSPRHRVDSAAHRPASAVGEYDGARDVGGYGRLEDSVVELSDPAERADEFPCVCLGTADHSRYQREKTDADCHIAWSPVASRILD